MWESVGLVEFLLFEAGLPLLLFSGGIHGHFREDGRIPLCSGNPLPFEKPGLETPWVHLWYQSLIFSTP